MFFKPIAVVAFTLITQTVAFTLMEVEDGQIPGFHAWPGVEDFDGDFLLSSFCFCAVPTPVPNEYSEAHYLQFDYYNAHKNTTFILNHLCRAKQDSRQTCLATRHGEPVYNLHYEWEEKLCRTWRNSQKDPEGHAGRENELCYFPEKYSDAWLGFLVPGMDKLKWNGQTRHLDERGKQGPNLRSAANAAETCETMCQQHANMPMLMGNSRAQSHIVAYEEMDDMCDCCA